MSSTNHQRRRSRLAAVGALLLTVIGVVVAPVAPVASAASTITQWNFNSSPPDASTGTGSTTPSTGVGTVAVVGGVTNPGFNSGAGSSDVGSDNSGYQTSTYAAQGTGDKTRGVQFNVSTVGQQDIVVSWDQRHSNTASKFVQFQYSTDGTTFTDFGSPFEASVGDAWFNGRTVDLSAITAVDDNPNFAFRVVATFAPGTGSYAASSPTGTYATTGTWRFDMVTVAGDPVGGPSLPTLSVNDVTVNEGNSGATTFSFTVGLSAAAASAVTFDIATADGTATTAGSDYVAASLTGQTIVAGLTSYTFDVSVVGDTNVELNETFFVNVTNVTGATVLDGQGTGTITNDDVAPPPATTIDLSTYQRIGRYNLPVPARVAAPAGSELALEVSAVTHHPTRDTLFVLGDEGTSVVQVGKNGQIIDSMTMPLGEFLDPEGLTYAGTGDQFVIVEERERRANLFTYVAGGTLTRADVQSVKLGTTIGNIGLEGATLDPQTGGFVFVKETSPQGIFQTGIDFVAGTATNGSPTTVNSTNLFDPALLGLTDIADVYSLSNLPAPLTDDNLLVLSQENGRIVNVGRDGAISNSLNIVGDLDNPLTVTTQGFEGVTMDANGLLYIVGEQAGGDGGHPQLWVYAPATYVYANAAPVEVSVSNPTASLPENASTVAAVRVGTVVVSDDALGTNTLSLVGADAASFELQGTGLFLRAGTVLDFETKASFSVTVQVDDATVGATPDAARSFTLPITDIVEAPPALVITEVAPWSSGNSPGVAADWFEVTNTSASAVDITGYRMDDSSALFGSSVALSGVTSIGAGRSAIFVEGDATRITAFVNTWFGGVTPPNVAFGTYAGSGVGLGTGGDAVNLYTASGALVTGVTFGASPAASPFATFDNTAGNPSVSTLSVVGVNGGYSVVDGAVTLIGSPGTTVSGDVRIRDIQGAAHRSPLLGQSVAGVPGIVTARVSNGFYLQDPQPDANDATSEAVFVFTSSAPTVTVGASVRVSGTVSEFRPGNNANNLTITQISGPTITVLSNGNPLPAPTVIGAGGRVPPSQVINDEVGNVETAGSFDAATDGIDFYESLEGMRVQIDQPVVVGPTNSFGELWVLANGGAGASVRTVRGGIVIRSDDYNPERIQIDDRIASTPSADVGAVLDTVIGVVSYDFNNYEVFTTSAATVATPSTLTREVTTLAGDADDLTVATFNVENLDPNDGAAKFNELATAIVTNLGSPDIVGLEEIQDNNGATNDSVVDATTTFQTLIAAIVAAGGPTYEFRQINPIDDTNGGEPGGNIRVGFLFDPTRVSFVDRPGGTATSATTVSAVGGEPQLSASPGLIDPTNAAFSSSRKPLVGEFVFNEQTVFVVVNHWNSKGGDQPLYGPNQPPTLTSESQRVLQATVVRNFVQNILAIDPDAKVAVIGDLNDFEFSAPLTLLEAAGLSTLIETLPQSERYTYNFQGNAQALDHILVSGGLFSSLAGYDVVNMNSEFADQISDHDPQVAQFTIAVPNEAPVASSQSVTTDEDAAVNVTLEASDADADTLTYTVESGPSNGTLSGIAPNLTYTPSPNYNGADSFTFRANDGTVDSNTATVSIAVTAVNDAPLLSAVATYDTGLGSNGAEIVSVRGDFALLSNAGANSVDVLDVSDVLNPTLLRRVTVPAGLNSVAIHPTLDLFLTVSGTANRTGTPGTLAAYRISDGVQIGTATVGIQPDSVGIAPNGLVAVVANEAEGIDAAPRVNGGPGSLTVVSLAGLDPTVTGQALSVTQVALPSYNGVPGFSTGRTDDLARLPITNDPDTLEPESVAFSADSAFAYVTLQENNGVVRLNLATNALTPFGLGSTTRVLDTVVDSTFNPATTATVFREPDGIAVIEIGGTRYFVTADEGDTRDGAGSGGVRGGRTVSVYDAATGALVGDTGNQLDVAAARFGVITSSALAVGYPDDRSNRGGSEPEVLDAITFGGRAIVAVGLERADAVAIVDITTPTAPAVIALVAAGNAPEGVKLVERDGQLYAFVANEVSGTLTIATVPVAPTVVNQSYTEDTPVALRDLLGLDIDVAGSFTVTLSVDAALGSLNTVSASGTLAQVNAALAGLTFTPAPNVNGPVTIGVSLSDGGSSATATIQLTGVAVNDAPVANAQSVTTAEDTAASITLTASDGDSVALTYTVVDGPANGTLSGTAPNLTYTPNANYSGSDSFTFRVSDGSAVSELATVSIVVTAVNDTPTIAFAAATPACAANGASASFGVTVTDVEAGALAVSATSSTARVTPSVSGTVVTLAVSGTTLATGTVTVTVTDAGGATASFSVNVVIGTNSGNLLAGTNGIDVIFGRGGADVLVGFGGADVLCGGDGIDSLFGGGDDDTLGGGQGSDLLFGEGGNDRLFGGDGADVLTGGAGVDAFDGGAGFDLALDRIAAETIVNVP